MKLSPALALSFSLLFSVCVTASAQPASPELPGEWIGGYEASGSYIAMKARFKSEKSVLSGALDLPQLRQTSVSVSQVRFEAPRLHFELPLENGHLVFDGKL